MCGCGSAYLTKNHRWMTPDSRAQPTSSRMVPVRRSSSIEGAVYSFKYSQSEPGGFTRPAAVASGAAEMVFTTLVSVSGAGSSRFLGFSTNGTAHSATYLPLDPGSQASATSG